MQPGWYTDPQISGQVRWHDGTNWTGHTQPSQPSVVDASPAPQPTWTSSPRPPADSGWQPGAPAGGQSASSSKSSLGKKVAIGVGAAFAALVVLGAVGASGSPSTSDRADGSSDQRAAPGPGPAPAEAAVDLGAMTCDVAAEEAVFISANSGDLTTKLLKVREPVVVEDHRANYQRPSGADDVLLIACEGAGVWEDGSTSPVRVEVTVDADEDVFVYYEAL